MVKYCPGCGTELQIESARACPSCGAPLRPEDSPPSPTVTDRAVRYIAIFSAALFAAFFLFAALFFAINLPGTFFPREDPEGARILVYGTVDEAAPRA